MSFTLNRTRNDRSDDTMTHVQADATIEYQKSRITERTIGSTVHQDTTASSLKGRGLCLLKAAELIFSGPFRVIRHIAFLFANIMGGLIILLTPKKFNSEELKGCSQLILSMSCALLLRPVAFICDISRAVLGATAHPGIAITDKKYS